MKKFITLLIVTVFGLSSCELLKEATSGLSDDEIVEGLKTALVVGTDSSVFKTNKKDGFFKDQLIKIAFPPEASFVMQHKNDVPGLSSLIDQVVLSMNRAAEDAASEAAPIFKQSITSLTITDGLDILNGINPASSNKSAATFDSTAATHYLQFTTSDQLTAAFAPKINISLNKSLIGSYSTLKLWNDLTTAYNAAALFAGWQSVNTDLGEYVTEQALKGMFAKVGQEEVKIRRDPWQWASTTVGNILAKVFGEQ